MEYENGKPKSDEDIKKIIGENEKMKGGEIPRGESLRQGETNGARMPKNDEMAF